MGFADFRAAVLADTRLQHELQVTDARDEFVRLVVKIARQKGFSVSSSDVEEAMSAGRKAWIERWI